jgi:hypothetical protein
MSAAADPVSPPPVLAACSFVPPANRIPVRYKSQSEWATPFFKIVRGIRACQFRTDVDSVICEREYSLKTSKQMLVLHILHDHHLKPFLNKEKTYPNMVAFLNKSKLKKLKKWSSNFLTAATISD